MSGVDTVALSYCAEITAVVELETRTVETLKFVDVAPAGTMIVVGTVATLGLLLERLITAPPDGAGALRVTVPVDVDPPLTLAGLRVSIVSVGSGAGVGVSPGVKVGVGSGGGVGVFVGDPEPIAKVALTLELL